MSNFKKIFVNVLLLLDLFLKFSARKHKAASTLTYDCLLKKNIKFQMVFSFFLRFALWDLQNLEALRSCIAPWNLGLWNSKDSGEC